MTFANKKRVDVQLLTAIEDSHWTLAGLESLGPTAEAWRVQRDGRVAFVCFLKLGREVVLNLSDHPEAKVQFKMPTLAVDANLSRDLPDFLQQLEVYARQETEAALKLSGTRRNRRQVGTPAMQRRRGGNLRCVPDVAQA